MIKILLLAGAALLAAAAVIRPVHKEADEMPDEETNKNDESADETPTQTVRATIKTASRDLDPVTLKGWSRGIFTCEDGEERKMYFEGDNGVYLTKGETGILTHRDGAFVSFEKDSGEVVGALFHIPADAKED